MGRMDEKTGVKNERLILCAVFGLFLIEILIRFYFADFSKSVHTYRDELRYLQIAKNIFANGSLSIYGAKNDYQKILYSIFLAPTFFIKNSIIRIKVISLINSILVSSSVFPGYLIIKKISNNNKKLILLSLLLLSVFTDMCYSLTFMSENLFLPLGMWEVYFLICLLSEQSHKKQILYSILNGIFSYLLYLTKEVSLYFVLAFLAVSLIIGIREKAFKTILRRCVGYLCSFTICFLLAKLTIFQGMNNSYDQTSLSAIGTHYRLEYMVYAFFIHLIFLGFACFLFSIVFPLISFKNLSRIQKISFLFLILCAVINAATIAFTISVREDLGRVIPRQHLRYYAPLMIPLLMIFLCSIEKNETELSEKQKIALIISTVVFAVAFVSLPSERIPYTISDFTGLHLYNYMFDFRFTDMREGAEAVVINNGIVILKFLTVAFALTGLILLLLKRKGLCLIFFVATIFIAEVINSDIAIKEIKKNYYVSEEQALKAEYLNEHLDKVDGNILVVVNSSFTENKIMDTYVSSDYCVINEWQLIEAAADKEYIDLKTTKFSTIYKNTNTLYDEYDNYKVIISYGELPFSEGKVTAVDDNDPGDIYIYQNLTPGQLWLNYGNE